MQLRPLGNSGFHVAPLAFGGNVFGWTIDEAASFRLLDAFVDAGLNLIDTADVYSRWAPGNQGGESETILGRWLKQSGQRANVVIATKVGMEMGPDQKGLSRAYIRQAVERSLQRLQIDTIDLYQAHKDDETTPLEETLGAFAELVREGKIKAIGASNYSAARLTEALRVSSLHGWPRYETLQPHYNLLERPGYEAELEPLCVNEKLGVISYFSLASGFLTGKYASAADVTGRARSGGVSKYLNDRGFKVVAALREEAAKLHATPAQVALAWLMARPSITAPIASATNLDQLRDLIAATHLNLPRQSMELLGQAAE
jgi:aryl-alcohol dehydrogenase-like predicted oxidoreductase